MTESESRAKIEEIIDDVEEEAEHNHQEEEDDDDDEIAAGSSVSIHSRAEKKARKLILKLGLKKIEGITRVTLKRSRTAIFVIAQPEVYKNPSSGAYIVFGEAKVEDTADTAARLASAAAGVDPSVAAAATSADPSAITADLENAAISAEPEAAATEPEDEVDDNAVDAAGYAESDISIVREQTNTSRAKAVAALKKNNGDIVNSIMDLTS